jgi:hypothetical protein
LLLSQNASLSFAGWESQQAGGLVARSLCLPNQRKGRTGVINFSGKIFEVGGEARKERVYAAQLAFSAAWERKVCSIELAIKMRQKRTIEEASAERRRPKEIQAVIEIVEKVVFRIAISRGVFKWVSSSFSFVTEMSFCR